LGAFEYLLMFAAVILAIAVTDIAVSLNRLLEAGRRVRWDWLAPMAALVAFLKIVTQWWTWFFARPLAGGLTFEMYVGVLVGAVLLFLLAAASLPSEADGPVIDLAAYYQRVRRRYWWLFAAHWLVSNAVDIWIQMQVTGARLDLLSPGLLVLPVAVSLALLRWRWWHALCLAAFTALYLAQFFGKGLGQ
jgi:hypothetical protein